MALADATANATAAAAVAAAAVVGVHDALSPRHSAIADRATTLSRSVASSRQSMVDDPTCERSQPNTYLPPPLLLSLSLAVCSVFRVCLSVFCVRGSRVCATVSRHLMEDSIDAMRSEAIRCDRRQRMAMYGWPLAIDTDEIYFIYRACDGFNRLARLRLMRHTRQTAPRNHQSPMSAKAQR